jgi:uncharacterized protein YdhG (YjbR/CyaY superfamily)
MPTPPTSTTKRRAAKKSAKKSPPRKRAATDGGPKARGAKSRTSPERASRTSPTPIDRYFEEVPAADLPAIRRLRADVRAAIGEPDERINYGVPMWRSDDKNVVGFAVKGDTASLYVMSPAVMKALASDLERYEQSKGTIRFAARDGLPSALVRKIVRARLAENAAGRQKKEKKAT